MFNSQDRKTASLMIRAIRQQKKLLSRNAPIEEQPLGMPLTKKLLWTLLLMGVVILGSCKVAQAAVPDKKAILSIIGEAENQGYTGMLAVACAIRNRGSLKGVYGLNAPRVINHRYSPATLKLATMAWAQSGMKDITHGASGWGNDKDRISFEKCRWWKNCKEVFRYKDHFFLQGGCMINLTQVSPMAEFEKEYRDGLNKQESLLDLRKHLDFWKPLCFDAWKQVQKMDEKRFIAFRKALAKERKGIFANNEDFMVIGLPAVMFRVSMIAVTFKVPFGLAFNRLKDIGYLVFENGIITKVINPKEVA